MTASDRQILLLTQTMEFAKALIGSNYSIVELWQYPSREAFLADKASEIRAVVTAGGLAIETSLVEQLPNLGLIAAVGAGYEGIDVDHAWSRGVAVTNGAGVNTDDVADLGVGLVLASVRRIVENDRFVRSGEWTRTERGPIVKSLRQRHIGIVGLGAIGHSVGTRLQAFGCDISWFGPNPKPDTPWPRVQSLTELAHLADVLVVAAPYGLSTRHLIDSHIIDLVGPNGLIVNIARGGLIDEAALISALREHRLGSAALDVQAEEPTPPSTWEGVPNVLLSQHIAGWASGSMDNVGIKLRENLRRFFAGQPLLTPVRNS